MPRNIPATLYSLLTITFAGMAAMCLGASPGRPLVVYEGLSGPMTVFLHRVTGAGMLLQTLVAYSLKDGADREKLGATTFRCVRPGFAAAAVWLLFCLLYGYAAPTTPCRLPPCLSLCQFMLSSCKSSTPRRQVCTSCTCCSVLCCAQSTAAMLTSVAAVGGSTWALQAPCLPWCAT
jgi:hypothetical protein